MMGVRKRICYFIFYWLLFYSLLNQYVVSSQWWILVPDVLLAFLFLFRPVRVKRSFWTCLGPVIPRLMVFLLLYGVAVGLINEMPKASILWGLRIVVRYLLLFLYVFQTFRMPDVERCKRILYKVYWANLCVAFFQRFIQNIYADAVGGTFGGNGRLFLFALLCTLLFAADYFRGRLPLRKFLYVIAGLFFFAMAAEIKMMYFTMPLAIYMVYVFIRRFTVAHVWMLVVAYFALVPTMKAVIGLMYDENYVNNVFDREKIEKETSGSYGFQQGGFNRSTALPMASAVILRDGMHMTLGYGIGSANTSRWFMTWIGRYYMAWTTYHFFATSYMLIEFGWFGFLLWALLLVLLAARFFREYRRTRSLVVKYWAGLGCVFSLLTYLLAWYNNMPYWDAYLFYFFWALCWVAIREEKKRLRRLRMENYLLENEEQDGQQQSGETA